MNSITESEIFLPHNYKAGEAYTFLVTYGRSIITQRSKNAKDELITGYGELGQLIYNDPLYKKYNKGNNSFVVDLFKDLGVGVSTGYACIQFYDKFVKGKFDVDVSAALGIFNDGISWSRIVHEHLPEEHRQLVAKAEDVLDCHCICHVKSHAA